MKSQCAMSVKFIGNSTELMKSTDSPSIWIQTNELHYNKNNSKNRQTNNRKKIKFRSNSTAEPKQECTKRDALQIAKSNNRKEQYQTTKYDRLVKQVQESYQQTRIKWNGPKEIIQKFKILFKTRSTRRPATGGIFCASRFCIGSLSEDENVLFSKKHSCFIIFSIFLNVQSFLRFCWKTLWFGWKRHF